MLAELIYCWRGPDQHAFSSWIWVCKGQALAKAARCAKARLRHMERICDNAVLTMGRAWGRQALADAEAAKGAQLDEAEQWEAGVAAVAAAGDLGAAARWGGSANACTTVHCDGCAHGEVNTTSFRSVESCGLWACLTLRFPVIKDV